MTDELKPCPFCGGKAALVPRAVNIALQKDPSNPQFGVSFQCGTCAAETANFIDEAHAAKSWNRRALAAAAPSVGAPTMRWDLDEDASALLHAMTGTDDEPTCVTLYVGESREDDGTVIYGLHAYESEYPEEGVTPLVEFAAPTSPAVVDGQALDDGVAADPPWVPVGAQLPECDTRPGSFGVPVFIRPEIGGEDVAFFGHRVQDSGGFYKYGAVIEGVTHWRPTKAEGHDAAPSAVPGDARPVDEELHQRVMNLPCKVPAGYPYGSELCAGVYREGHRDARHAAAELIAARQAGQQQGESK